MLERSMYYNCWIKIHSGVSSGLPLVDFEQTHQSRPAASGWTVELADQLRTICSF